MYDGKGILFSAGFRRLCSVMRGELEKNWRDQSWQIPRARELRLRRQAFADTVDGRDFDRLT